MSTKLNERVWLTIIAWNIYIGSRASVAREHLKTMHKYYNPEIFALMEATNLYGDLEKLGYNVIQLKPSPLRKGSRPGQANIALLVRKDIEIVQSFAMRMKTFWRGPKHGWDQDPRVYRWVKIKHGGKTWKVGCAHTPFGEAARTESRNRLIAWLQKSLPSRPTILVLDANMRLDEFETTIAKPGGAEAAGTGIDLVGWKNCRLVNRDNLGKGPSDHPAKMYTFTLKKKLRSTNG